MDQIKTGALIRQLRLSAGLTQKQLADSLSISDKTISKWECGNGCPDISLLPELAKLLGTDIGTLLSGSVNKNESEKGNMKKLKFYVCKNCGNIITATSEASVSCCGSVLTAALPQKAEGEDMLKVEDIGGEWFITSNHEMKKGHFISFVAYVSDSSAMIFKQYPEWDVQITLPLYRSGQLVWYCTEHGLFRQDIVRRLK
ncbi:MAG: helix-turn-helix domain-containing protein [Ruminococcus sp.]|uniref:helix-turn-helix domain-containing protein n=1 Tax=Ruminococcus sp. TaxID=41978 RepID=UPI0025E2E910|nr:helix-turn-helix domain-containing protein [Ruminococcus sp.]MCR5601897.1 helix-turn-helix domain-containing protein [Ruminococcus sp.]